MKKLEDVLYNLKAGNKLLIRKDKENKVFGAELKYDGCVPKDISLVDIERFIKAFPNLIKHIDKDKIYYLSYSMFNEKYENMILDKDNNIIDSTSSNDLYESISELENTYSNIISKLFKVKRKNKIYWEEI